MSKAAPWHWLWSYQWFGMVWIPILFFCAVFIFILFFGRFFLFLCPRNFWKFGQGFPSYPSHFRHGSLWFNTCWWLRCVYSRFWFVRIYLQCTWVLQYRMPVGWVLVVLMLVSILVFTVCIFSVLGCENIPAVYVGFAVPVARRLGFCWSNARQHDGLMGISSYGVNQPRPDQTHST